MIQGMATKAVCDERDNMANANYVKGVVLEREIVNAFKSVGCKASRTAGSHGAYDLFAIGTKAQLDLGWDKLEIMQFRPGNDAWIRTGRRYVDTLYPMIVNGFEESAVFIQCKRKEK